MLSTLCTCGHVLWPVLGLGSSRVGGNSGPGSACSHLALSFPGLISLLWKWQNFPGLSNSLFLGYPLPPPAGMLPDSVPAWPHHPPPTPCQSLPCCSWSHLPPHPRRTLPWVRPPTEPLNHPECKASHKRPHQEGKTSGAAAL